MNEIDTGLHYPIPLNQLSEKWVVGYLQDFDVEIQSGFACGKHSESNIGVAHYRPMNVSKLGQIDTSTLKFVQSSADARRLREGDVLFNNTNSPELVGKTAYVDAESNDVAYSNHMTRLRFREKVNPKFAAIQVHYLWQSGYFLHRCVKHVNQASISARDLAKSVPFVKPPLKQQHRIVEKIETLFSELDHGVKTLETARQQLKVYRQAVLKHAFEGKLTEHWRKQHRNGSAEHAQTVAPIQRADRIKLPDIPDHWEYVMLARLGELARGKSKHRPRNDPSLFGGKYPFIQTAQVKSANRIIRDYSQTYNEKGLRQSKLWPAGTLCITIAANIADTAFLGIDACFPDSIVGFKAHDSLADPKFVELFIQHSRTRIEAYAPATAQKNINLKTLEKLVIPKSSLAEQHEIVREIESRFSVIDNLEKTIDDNLKKAEALRQSILKKAFSGELVSAETAQADESKTVPFPQPVEGIHTTDLHAGIVALALRAHESDPKYLKHFHRTKAEKISHLVEAHLGIDLGRHPVRDAAGPNDYRQLRKIESRAKKTRWLEVQERPKRTDYARGRRFDELVTRVEAALGDRLADVTSLIDGTLRMNTRQAEIVATVYAAWNNLLMDGTTPDDEQIVLASREQWHPDKLDIPRDSFFKAIGWMRDNSLIPIGRGRYVPARGT